MSIVCKNRISNKPNIVQFNWMSGTIVFILIIINYLYLKLYQEKLIGKNYSKFIILFSVISHQFRYIPFKKKSGWKIMTSLNYGLKKAVNHQKIFFLQKIEKHNKMSLLTLPIIIYTWIANIINPSTKFLNCC